MKRPTDIDLPFIVMHGDHEAWRQRCLMPGDFAPGLMPIPNYVSYADGTLPEVYEAPKCAGCGEVPRVEDLNAVDARTGRSDFLDPYRNGTIRSGWPPPTPPETCWYCNGSEGVRDVEGVRLCALCCEFLKE
jgi:hypothetical protein